MKILLTAFEPFGGESVNPALEILLRIKAPQGVELFKCAVPVVFGKAADTVAEAVMELRPDAVLSLGQAGGRRAIAVEKIAVNARDARLPDNEGNAPRDELIRKDGPAAYFATLPVTAMVDAINRAGVEAALSYHAGAYVCNDLFYDLRCRLDRLAPAVRSGFIHVPFLPEQVENRPGTPSMPLDDMIKAVTAALEAIRDNA